MAKLDLARIEWLAEEIRVAAAHTNASEHRLLTRVREFIEIGGWAEQNARTPAHWLSWWIKVDLITAREKVRVALKLGELRRTDAAFARSEISYTQTRAIARVACEKTEPLLLQYAQHSTGQQLEKICSGFRRSRDALEGPGEYAEEERCIRRRDRDDNLVDLTIKGLSPDEASAIQRAIEAALAQSRQGTRRTRAGAATPVAANDSAGTAPASAVIGEGAADDSAETAAAADAIDQGAAEDARGAVTSSTPLHTTTPVSADDSAGTPADARTPLELAVATARPPERVPAAARVDALVAVCEAFLCALPAGRVRSRTELIVSVDRTALLDAAQGVGRLRDGSVLSPATLRMLACDAAVVELVRGPDGQTLDVGRARRTIPAPILRALEDRDEGCIFPGCRNDRWVDGHHLRSWIDGGATKLDNLCLLCRYHHRRLHLGRYTLTRRDGRFLFHDLHGRLIVDRPRLPDLGPDPWAIVRENVDPDLLQTAFAERWDGGDCDYNIAIEGLCDRVGLGEVVTHQVGRQA